MLVCLRDVCVVVSMVSRYALFMLFFVFVGCGFKFGVFGLVAYGFLGVCLGAVRVGSGRLRRIE